MESFSPGRRWVADARRKLYDRG